MHHFCTYFDHNYLPRAMVMLESLHEHSPESIVHVLCLSQECLEAMRKLDYSFVRLIPLAELEENDQELLATRSTRSLIEYYFTITPCLPWYLLNHKSGIEEITYLDADLMFFSSPEPIFDEADNASVLITPHRFSINLLHYKKYGLYNVSWMTFRKDDNGLKCLSWYRDRCVEWCKDHIEDDKFADQKYLDKFELLFDKVHIIENKGAGLAPWNLRDMNIVEINNTITINKDALVFYHAQSFKHILGPFYSSGLKPYSCRISNKIKKYILKPYMRKFTDSIYRVNLILTNTITFNGIRSNENLIPFIAKIKIIIKEFKAQTLLINEQPLLTCK